MIYISLSNFEAMLDIVRGNSANRSVKSEILTRNSKFNTNTLILIITDRWG